MKGRETRGVREDRLSGIMPDPSRLSAVSRSPLVRAGSRWLSFARSLSRGRGRRGTAADALGFVESLYGGKFAAAEGGAFSLDKVYRTAGGRPHVSETRLSLSVHPRFDLRLLNVAVSLGFTQTLTTPALTPLSHTGARVREQGRDARHVTNNLAPSSTAQTWNVFRSGAAGVPRTFNFVSVLGGCAQQARGPEWARPAARVERTVRDDAAARTGVETSRPTEASAPASPRPTGPDMRLFVTHELFATHAPRQEFVNLLLNTYLSAAASRELLSVKMAGGSSRASAAGAMAQGATERLFASAHTTLVRRPAARSYAAPAPRHAPSAAAEVRAESRSAETGRGHAPPRDPLPPLLHVLPPASLLSSRSETYLTMHAAAAGHNTTYHPGGLAPAPSLQLRRTHAAPPGTRKGTAAVGTTRLHGQTLEPRPGSTRDVLSYFRTFVERVQSTVADITHAGDPNFFTGPGAGPTLLRGLVQVTARQRGAANDTAPGRATSPGPFGRPVEFIRRISLAEFKNEGSTHGAGTRTAPDVYLTQAAPGAGTFLFATTLLGRTTRGATASAPPPTAAAVMRSGPAAGTGREVTETRAARPEGMALELVRHRREQVLELPRPGYVFTQPQRARPEERQVITKASREEIVEVVRREVRSLASSAPVTPAPPHAGLSGIADEVYSTLVRRLMVEKERLGRF